MNAEDREKLIKKIRKCLALSASSNEHESAPRSEPHYHLVCKHAKRSDLMCSKDDFFLNGYRADGTSVWSKDFLIFHGWASLVQLDLFTPSQ